MMATFTFTAGRFLHGKVREFLNHCKFKGMDIDYLESSGFIERDFTIKGSDEDVAYIRASIGWWIKDNGLQEEENEY
jgi:hypothetical protein